MNRELDVDGCMELENLFCCEEPNVCWFGWLNVRLNFWMLNVWIAVKPLEAWILVRIMFKIGIELNVLMNIDGWWTENGDSTLGLGSWIFCDLYVIIIGEMAADY